MGNYTIFYMLENPRRGRQARNFTMKCSENSRSQIVFRTDIFRKLSLVAPEIYIIAIKCANFSTFCAISSRIFCNSAVEKINKQNGVGNYLLRR